MTPVMAPETILPPSEPAERANLAEYAAAGQGTAVPEPLRRVLEAAASALSRGSAVTVTPMSTVLSTTEAAALLSISRPTLVKLLEEGKIPFEQPSAHRLVRLEDVLAYKESRSSIRRAFLDESLREALEDGSFYDTADDYADALATARRTTSK
ncbi:MAG: excisionase family DNA-binding protein [Bifidobacteriaceae bacterium]|jgi:excisionase family DNA binding protein|nr:excisionase family DNA-binding protein [Bifidobacteriaceae bacterium]